MRDNAATELYVSDASWGNTVQGNTVNERLYLAHGALRSEPARSVCRDARLTAFADGQQA